MTEQNETTTTKPAPDFTVEHSPEFEKFAEALAMAQLEIEGADKDNQNPHFKSKYATLASVWSACHGPLNKNGIAILQVPGTNKAGASVLYTWLLHKSGQWFRGEWRIKPVQDNPQGVGSAVTYARRYSLAAMTGVAPIDDDDDGNAASGRPVPKQRDERQSGSGNAGGSGWEQLQSDAEPEQQPAPENRGAPAEFKALNDAVDQLPDDIADAKRELRQFKGKKFVDIADAELAAVQRVVEEMAQKTKIQQNRASLTVLAAILRNESNKRAKADSSKAGAA